jgi:hypothetical protein
MAMITLEFETDEAVLAEDAHLDPASANPAALEETYFVMPFRFAIDGAELLGVNGKRTHPLPLLGFSSDLHQTIKNLRVGEAKKFYLAGGGHLVLERVGRTLRVFSSLTGKTAFVDADSLSHAVRFLLARVRALLAKHFPKMQTHPAWQNWFPQ